MYQILIFMNNVTYTKKKKTLTLYHGSDGLEYRECQKHKKTFFLRISKCPHCQLEKELIEKEHKQKKEIKQENTRKQKLVQYTILWKHYQILIDTIRDFLNIGYTPEILLKAFFMERNPPYDLSHGAKFHINIPSSGPVLDHVNGRECIGYYCVYAILIGDVKGPEDLMDFYEMYCGQINVDADFNNNVIKPYQNEEGAISPEVYIEVLKNERNVNLTEEEKEYFRSKFLYSKYGKILKKDVINLIKNGGQAKN